MNNPEIQRVEKFEYSGLGKGPYSFAGLWIAPPKSLQEHNPQAYRDAWREAPKMTNGFHITSCAHCGSCISECWLVASSDGLLFAVGSSCVNKIGKKILNIDKEIRRHRNQKAGERRDRIAAEFKLQIMAILNDPDFSDHLKSQKHPWKSDLTLRDYHVNGLSYTSQRKYQLYNLTKLKAELDKQKGESNEI